MKHTAKMRASARRRAISLIEGVLYLVLAMAVIVGGIVFFQQAQLSNRVTDTSRAAVGISSQIRALYHQQTAFGDNVDLTEAAVRSGAVPSNFIGGEAGVSIVHPFDEGGVTITGLGKGFVMSYFGLSPAACQRMAVVDETGTGPMGIGIVGLTIGAAGDVDHMDGPEMLTPVKPETVSAACATGSQMAVFYSASTGGDFDAMMSGFTGPDLGSADRDNPWNYPIPSPTLMEACGFRPSRSDRVRVWEACSGEWSMSSYGQPDGTWYEICNGSKPTAYDFPGDHPNKTSFIYKARSSWDDCYQSQFHRGKTAP
jgi:hypothetical protein